MRIAFIGIGNVGFALANHLQRLGHSVMIAARDAASHSVREAVARNPAFTVIPVRQAVSAAELVFLATPFEANEKALGDAGAALDGKVLVDCTNPVGPGLTHGLSSTESGSERAQRTAPRARVVKAFTIYGFENFGENRYTGYGNLRPAMLIAGDDEDAKRPVAALCEQLGWEPVDVGPLSASLHLEHMTLLWIKMARMQGRGTGFTWAMLRA